MTYVLHYHNHPIERNPRRTNGQFTNQHITLENKLYTFQAVCCLWQRFFFLPRHSLRISSPKHTELLNIAFELHFLCALQLKVYIWLNKIISKIFIAKRRKRTRNVNIRYCKSIHPLSVRFAILIWNSMPWCWQLIYILLWMTESWNARLFHV